MKILITGITGFIGLHLAEYCIEKPGVKVYGTVLPTDYKKHIKKAAHIKNKVGLIKCDLTKEKQVTALITKLKPNIIFHLAGQSQVASSWNSPTKTLLNNIVSDVNIFEAVRHQKNKPIVITAGSSEEYGLAFKSELPLRENNPLRPLSPYAVSKITQEKLAFQYYKSYGIRTVLLRCFNAEGPRRAETFAVSGFAKQIADIEKGRQKPVIHVGNLEAKRDFTDVRDVARAYWLASQKCEFGEVYNVCSGQARSIASVLKTLLALSNVKNIKILKDPKRNRPSDIPITVGSFTKFKKQTGWKPEIAFEKTAQDVLDYFRSTP